MRQATRYARGSGLVVQPWRQMASHSSRKHAHFPLIACYRCEKGNGGCLSRRPPTPSGWYGNGGVAAVRWWETSLAFCPQMLPHPHEVTLHNQEVGGWRLACAVGVGGPRRRHASRPLRRKSSLDFIKEKSHKYYDGNKMLTNSKFVVGMDSMRKGVSVSDVGLLRQQAKMVEQYHLEALLFCPDAWALRHRFVNQETGEVRRARCDRWECLYCGPRKVDLWRRLISEAHPTLHVVLTKVGWTVQDASRVLTTALQYLRRGSKGLGPNRLGAREAYAVECFSVLEEHKHFERVGFHWHILMNGVDYLPQTVVVEALRSATKGRSYIAYVRNVKNGRAVGYVTKYLTKEVTRERRGKREVQRELVVPVLDAVEGIHNEQGNSYVYRPHIDTHGQVVADRLTQTIEVVSRARRIRYTRHFFPTSTFELRARVFADLGNGEIALSREGIPDLGESVQGASALTEPSSWTLFEYASFSTKREDYEQRRHDAVEESLVRLHDGEWLYSGRLVNMWAAQKRLQREGQRLMASQ